MRNGLLFPIALIGLCVAHAEVGADADWAAYHGDPAGSHYSKLDQITPENVAGLVPAWTFRAGDALKNSQIQCNPLIVDGVLYGTTPQLKLFALDAATGERRWIFDPFADSKVAGARGLNRGLAWWRDGEAARILFTAGSYIYAIDAKSGQPVQAFGDKGRVDLYEGLDRDVRGLYLVGTSPGAIYRDVFIVSTRVGEGPGPAAPGHIRAYDVRTGERRWIFHTIPQPDQPGYETWPADAWTRVGGANNWQGMVIDPDTGIAYVPTGSAAFDFWGGNRVGQNLYANCLLALDALTGKLKWHFQFVHHDLWDRDPPAPPVLCVVQRKGKKIPAVAQVTKSGHVWVFDRATGESLFPWREMPVPKSDLAGEVSWPTQPVPDAPRPFARQQFTEAEVTDRTPEARQAVLERLRKIRPHVPFLPPSQEGTLIFPGFDGGAEWGGAAVDPEGVLYVNANEMAWLHHMIPNTPADASAGQAMYAQLCIACHGPDRAGNVAANVPSLVNIGSRLKPFEIAAVIRTGRGSMPSFAFLNDTQRSALVDFLVGSAAQAPVDTAAGKREASDPLNGATVPFISTGYHRFLDPDGYPALRPPWGTLNAIDLNTGEYRWTVPLGDVPAARAADAPATGMENYGGPLVTAGGLVFMAGTKDEKFRAFDRKTGKQLWETQLPAGGYASPATYTVNGRQFVVIACGGGKMGTKSGDTYIAFALPESKP